MMVDLQKLNRNLPLLLLWDTFFPRCQALRLGYEDFTHLLLPNFEGNRDCLGDKR